MRQGENLRATIGGYFQLRLLSPYSVLIFHAKDFLTKPNNYNSYISESVDILCGNVLFELQSNSYTSLSL